MLDFAYTLMQNVKRADEKARKHGNHFFIIVKKKI